MTYAGLQSALSEGMKNSYGRLVVMMRPVIGLWRKQVMWIWPSFSL